MYRDTGSRDINFTTGNAQTDGQYFGIWEGGDEGVIGSIGSNQAQLQHMCTLHFFYYYYSYHREYCMLRFPALAHPAKRHSCFTFSLLRNLISLASTAWQVWFPSNTQKQNSCLAAHRNKHGNMILIDEKHYRLLRIVILGMKWMANPTVYFFEIVLA